jgi:hypothetical protein
MDITPYLPTIDLFLSLAIGSWAAYRHITLPAGKVQAIENSVNGVLANVAGLQATADQHTAQITAMTAPADPPKAYKPASSM